LFVAVNVNVNVNVNDQRTLASGVAGLACSGRDDR